MIYNSLLIEHFNASLQFDYPTLILIHNICFLHHYNILSIHYNFLVNTKSVFHLTVTYKITKN